MIGRCPDCGSYTATDASGIYVLRHWPSCPEHVAGGLLPCGHEPSHHYLTLANEDACAACYRAAIRALRDERRTEANQ